MIADQETLADLELFHGRESRPALFGYIDRTRTRGGSARLRERLRRPFSNADEIRATHKAIRAILEHRELFRKLPGQYAVASYEHYSHWRLTPPAVGSGVGLLIEAAQIWAADYHEWSQILTGVRQTVHMLRALGSIADAAAEFAEGDLATYVHELQECQRIIATGKLPHSPPEKWAWWTTLRADQVLRRDARAAVQRSIELLFEIDALVSAADVIRDCKFVLPEVEDGEPRVHAESVFYPLLDTPVRNPLRLSQERRLLFITGPNMAGKTTYLRSSALCIYLAHAGMAVPAAAFSFAPCDTMFTAFGLVDDVRNRVSFFQAEARRARAVAAAIARGERVLALLDEPFKGTNVRDAFQASTELLTRFAACHDCLFVVSSHLIEVAERLKGRSELSLCCFAAAEAGDRLEFDYQLRDGVSAQRLGMRVLQEHEVFSLLDSFLGSC